MTVIQYTGSSCCCSGEFSRLCPETCCSHCNGKFPLTLTIEFGANTWYCDPDPSAFGAQFCSLNGRTFTLDFNDPVIWPGDWGTGITDIFAPLYYFSGKKIDMPSNTFYGEGFFVFLGAECTPQGWDVIIEVMGPGPPDGQIDLLAGYVTGFAPECLFPCPGSLQVDDIGNSDPTGNYMIITGGSGGSTPNPMMEQQPCIIHLPDTLFISVTGHGTYAMQRICPGGGGNQFWVTNNDQTIGLPTMPSFTIGDCEYGFALTIVDGVYVVQVLTRASGDTNILDWGSTSSLDVTSVHCNPVDMSFDGTCHFTGCPQDCLGNPITFMGTITE
jgi:hypothetical protein